MKEQIIDVTIPYPKIGSGKKKNQLLTLNNLTSINHFILSKVKNDFKKMMKDWFLPDGNVFYDYLVIETKIVRHNRRKLDAVNTAYIVKLIEDCMMELGWIIDDCNDEIHLLPTSYRTDINETMLQIKIKGVIK